MNGKIDPLVADAVSALDILRTKASLNPALEDEFNDMCERRCLGIYMRRGKLYASIYGRSHTARILAA